MEDIMEMLSDRALMKPDVAKAYDDKINQLKECRYDSARHGKT